MSRGGYRRRYVLPAEVPVWVRTGRWGPRRARVEQCATLAAEFVYDKLILEGQSFGPGWRATLSWVPQSNAGPDWDVLVEVLPNAVWRRGRLFLRCPHCERRTTRVYVPIEGLRVSSRVAGSVGGLVTPAKSWCYKPIGLFGKLLGPIAPCTT